MFSCRIKGNALLSLIVMVILCLIASTGAHAQTGGASGGGTAYLQIMLADIDEDAANLPFIQVDSIVESMIIGGVSYDYVPSVVIKGSSALMPAYYETDGFTEEDHVPLIVLSIPQVVFMGTDGSARCVFTSNMGYSWAEFVLSAGGREFEMYSRGYVELPLLEGVSTLRYTYHEIDSNWIERQYSGSISITYVDENPFIARSVAYIPESELSGGTQYPKAGAFTLSSGGGWDGLFIRILPYRMAEGGASPFQSIESIEARVDDAAVNTQGEQRALAVTEASYDDLTQLSKLTGMDINNADVSLASSGGPANPGGMLLLDAAAVLGGKDKGVLDYSFTSEGKRWSSTLYILKETPAKAASPGGNTAPADDTPAREVRGFAVIGLGQSDVLEPGRETDIQIAPVGADGALIAADDAFRQRFGYLRAGSMDAKVCGVYVHAPDNVRLSPLSAGSAVIQLWYDGNGLYRSFEEAPASHRLSVTVAVGKTVEQMVRELVEAYLGAAAAPQQTQTAAAVADDTFEYGHVICSSLNIRAEPSAKSRSLGRLRRWDTFIVSGEADEDWYAVEFSDGTGYIASRFTATQPYSGQVQYAVTTAATRLYADADTSSRTLIALKKNTYLLCTGEEGAYYTVLLNGRSAYVPRKHIKVL